MKVAVVGGGPSGMMAAIVASQKYQVTLFERNTSLGKKLLMTGNGRCNVLNNKNSQNFINACREKKFKNLYSWFSECSVIDLIEFFNQRGVYFVEEDDNRLFPTTNSAKTILDCLVSELEKCNVSVVYNCQIQNIEVIDNKFVLSNDNKNYMFDKVILACGGASYRASGSDGSGFVLAQKLGHKILPLFPAEVGIVCQDTIIQSKLLQGVSLRGVEVIFTINDKKYRDSGDLIVTHYGFSGPVIFKYSNLIARNKSAKLIIKSKGENIPKSWLKFLNDNNCLDTGYQFKIVGTLSLDKAFVTDGGIDLKEINNLTLTSKLVANLAICGEMLDLAAPLGGYNITIALISGYLAGKYI